VLPEIGIIERRINGRCEEMMLGVDGNGLVATATLISRRIRNLDGVVPIGAQFKEKVIPVSPSSSYCPGILVAPPHMLPPFNPYFHHRHLLRFLLQSPISHDHSSLVTPIQMTHMPPLMIFSVFLDDLFMFSTSVALIALPLYFMSLSFPHVPSLPIHFPRTAIEYKIFSTLFPLTTNYGAICRD
jgi:hypothetical protein